MLKRSYHVGEIDIHICVYQRYPDIITFGIDADDDKIFSSGRSHVLPSALLDLLGKIPFERYFRP